MKHLISNKEHPIIKLRHGSVPFAGIKDLATREAVMKLNENILALAEVVKTMRRERVIKNGKEA